MQVGISEERFDLPSTEPQDERDGVLDRLRQSPLAGLARRTLDMRQKHYAVWNDGRNARGDTFQSSLDVFTSAAPEAECRWTAEGAKIAISSGMTALVEQLFVALTGLMAIDAHGGFVMRPYADHPAPHQTPDDLMLAAFLIDQAIGFVADHEFVHATNGHALLVADGGWRSASDVAETDLLRALELEADRSAVYCLVDDLLEGRAATNDLIDRLGETTRIALIGLAIGMLCAVWLAAEDEDGIASFHPAARTRVYMLLGPSLFHALSRAGFSSSAIADVQHMLGQLLIDLGARSRRLSPLARVFSPTGEEPHERENARLETVYRTVAGPMLAQLHFVPLRRSG